MNEYRLYVMPHVDGLCLHEARLSWSVSVIDFLGDIGIFRLRADSVTGQPVDAGERGTSRHVPWRFNSTSRMPPLTQVFLVLGEDMPEEPASSRLLAYVVAPSTTGLRDCWNERCIRAIRRAGSW